MPVSPWPDPGLTLADQGLRVGHYVWVEARLFEILGGWVQQVAALDVKLQLAAQSHRHAWHAEMWRHRLPVLAEVDPGRLVAAANPAVAAVIDALAEPSGRDRTVEKLVGLYRVAMPRLVAGYRAHLDNATTVAGAPIIRVLGLVLADAAGDRRRGEQLISDLLVTDADARRAADHQVRLEGLVGGTGGWA